MFSTYFGIMKELIASEKNESFLFEKVMLTCSDALKQRATGKGKKENMLNRLGEEYQLQCINVFAKAK